MIKLVSWLLFSFSIGGCNFDYNREYDLRYPATLVLRNDTQMELVVTEIVKLLDAEGGFVISGEKVILPGEMRNLRVSESVYNNIRTGSFILKAICAAGKQWEVAGTRLNRKAIYNDKEWSVTVSISNCGQ